MKKTKYSLKDKNETANLSIGENDFLEINNLDYENFDTDNNSDINNMHQIENEGDSGSTGSSNSNNGKLVKQRHTHELLGSTKLAGHEPNSHNHRFAGVTSESMRQGNTHYHRIKVNTDFYDHYHQIIITTGPAIPVGDDRHVHFVMGATTLSRNHRHRFIFTTLIDRPIIE